jgi:hypothetical protein
VEGRPLNRMNQKRNWAILGMLLLLLGAWVYWLRVPAVTPHLRLVVHSAARTNTATGMKETLLVLTNAGDAPIAVYGPTIIEFVAPSHRKPVFLPVTAPVLLRLHESTTLCVTQQFSETWRASFQYGPTVVAQRLWNAIERVAGPPLNSVGVHIRGSELAPKTAYTELVDPR